MQVKQAEIAGFTLTESIHPGGEDLPWHSHEGATICYVLRGDFKERSRGQALLCTPATLKFMPAGETHCNEFDSGEVRGLLIEVDSDRMRALGSLAPLLDEKRHFQGGPAAALALKIYHEFRVMDAAAPLAIEGLMLELVAWTLRAGLANGAGTEPRWLTVGREFIDASFTERIGLGKVAQVCGVHPVTLARAFRRHYRCTVGEYVRRARLEIAAAHLGGSDRRISEIALAAGFADQAHFSNAFRSYAGTSPKRFRDRFTR